MELLSVVGYIVASLSYFIFILLLLAARNNSFAGKLVLAGSVVTMLSFTMGALQLEHQFSLSVVLLFETLKIPCWALLLLATRENIQTLKELITNPKTKEYLLIWFGLSVGLWSLTALTTAGESYLYLLFLVLNLWCVVLLEQLYRNANVKAKWALWPLVIALGSIGVFEFILFAQASMLNQLNTDLWAIRAFIAILAVPFLLISIRRMKDWSVNVFISRQVVFYSSMLMISGLYLLVMAFAGYILNYLGGEWGDTLSVAFIIMGGIVLAVLLMTERIRREVKVFITKHFFANKYDYRIEWLKLIEQLKVGEGVDYYQAALTTISTTLKINNGLLVKKVAPSQYQVLSSNGINFSEGLAKELAMIEDYCKSNAWIVDLAEYQQVEKSYQGLFLDTALFSQERVAIIVPIFSKQNFYGFFALSSPEDGNKLLNWEDRDLLSAISKQLSHYLTLNEASEALSQAKQFDAFNRMSAFLVHDLKNVQAQLELINTNAKRHRNNPEFVDDVFETVESAANRLSHTLQQLRNKQVEATKSRDVELSTLITDIVSNRIADLPRVTIEQLDNANLSIDEEKIASVLNHLIQNAQEATSDNGWVKINATSAESTVIIKISDNGSGMSQTFIQNRLFKPFDTTKGNAGMGIGVFEAKQFIESIHGELVVLSEQGKGTVFKLTLPLNS